jgi:hypothetical protein
MLADAAAALDWCLDALDNPPPPPDRDHACGPEGACDGDCMDRAYYADRVRQTRKLLAELRRRVG